MDQHVEAKTDFKMRGGVPDAGAPPEESVELIKLFKVMSAADRQKLLALAKSLTTDATR